MDALELIGSYVEDRGLTAALVNKQPPLALGTFCFLVGALSLYVAQALAHRLVLLPFGWIACLLALLWQLASGFVLTGLLHLILECGGARGRAGALFVLFGLAELTWVLALPLVLIFQALLPRVSWVMGMAFFSVGFLTFYLKARALQDNYNVGAGSAWLALSVPYLAGILAVLIVVGVAVAGAFLSLSRGFF